MRPCSGGPDTIDEHGLGMAQTVDPTIGRVPVLASFLVVMSTRFFCQLVVT